MTLGLIFWILMLLWLVFGVYVHRTAVGTPIMWGGDLLLFILILCLGWAVFGAPIK